MGFPYLRIDTAKTEFVVSDWAGAEHRFPGTVVGAVELTNFCHEERLELSMSSDLNHPGEFPRFERHAVDIAAGYLDGAIADGLISVEEA